MPELVHECGRRLKFPPGAEGKRGRCPHCGGQVEVPGNRTCAPPARMHLDPPMHWDEYQAYLDGRGPAPRPLVMPQKLMLQTEAEEVWERRSQVRWSKYRCPSCKERVYIDQLVCLACGLDFRTGMVLGKQAKLNEKGMAYLAEIPWLADAPPPPQPDGDDDDDDDRDGRALKAPRRRKRKF